MQHSDEEWFWERYHPDGQVPCACAVRVRQLCVCASAATPSVRPCPRPCPSLRTWFARLFVGACSAFVSGLLPACLPAGQLALPCRASTLWRGGWSAQRARPQARVAKVKAEEAQGNLEQVMLGSRFGNSWGGLSVGRPCAPMQCTVLRESSAMCCVLPEWNVLRVAGACPPLVFALDPAME